MSQQPVDPKAYYGYLFQNNKQPTKVLNALLRGIANYISTNIGDPSEKNLTPAKLAAFYKAVGGNYDSLFVDVPYPSISWIYASIGCQHTLQPTDFVFDPPSIPALTTRGFVNWQSIEILLGPEEHVPFMQFAVRNFVILHPETGERFPPELTIDAFPLVPDPVIVKWHSDCAERLRRRATPVDDRPDLPPRPKVYVDTRVPLMKRSSTQSKVRPGSYFESKTGSIRRDINFKHVPGTAVPGTKDRPVRPKLSGSPTHRAREFLAPEFMNPESPRLSRSRRRSVPENMNSPVSSPQPAVSPDDHQSPNTEHIRRHSHPRQQRRGSMSSDASSEREEPLSPIQGPRRPSRRNKGPEIRFQSPIASPHIPTPPQPSPEPRFKSRISDDIDEDHRRKYTIPIDQSGKLSAPFLLGKRDSDRHRSNPRGSNVRWQDLADGHDIWRREKSSEEEREGKPRRRVSRDIDRDIDRDSGSGGGSRSDRKRHERDPTRQRPVRHSSQDDSPREREWEGRSKERERDRDRERRPASPPVRGVDGRFYPTGR